MNEPNEMTDESLMPFGQYGPKRNDHRKLCDVPARYLLWLWDDGVWQDRTGRNAPLHRYIAKNMKALEMDAPDYIVTHAVK